MTKVKISIRYKFLMATSFLLVGSVFAYLGLASHVFTKDKTELVYDYNRNYVTSISSDLSNVIDSSENKMKLAALLMGVPGSRELTKNLFDKESNIASLFVSKDFKTFPRKLFWEKSFYDAYGIVEEDQLQIIENHQNFPWEEIQKKGEHLWALDWKRPVPLFAFAKVVVSENESRRQQFVVLATIRLDHLAKVMRENQLSDLYLLNRNGELIFSGESTISKEGLAKLLPKFNQQGVKSSVFSFTEEGEQYLAAFANAKQKRFTLFSRASKRKALSVVDRFIYRSILFASIVFTLAFIVAIFFSRNLTRPIEKLLDAMKKVASGNLSIAIQLRSKDEIQLLADNFNHMIGDLRASRKELEEINHDLENKVKERTAKLEEQNIAVKEAQEALLRTSRLAAAGEIAGRAAHEVLNPLTSILTRLHKMEDRLQAKEKNEMKLWDDIATAWKEDLSVGTEKLFSEWSKKSSLDNSKSLLEEDLENVFYVKAELQTEVKEIHQDLGFLLNEGRRINKIVQSMRSLNRTSEDKRNYSLGELLKESFKIMADSMDQYSISYSTPEDADDVYVLVDKDEFTQAMTNLLRNSIYALKKTDSEERKIYADVEVLKDKVYVYVGDTGSGIAPEDQSRLFDSNFSTKPSDEGTGLGLSISRRFFRSFDGDLELYSSELNKGTKFKIILPIVVHQGRVSA